MLKKSLFDSWSFFINHVFSISAIILPIVIPLVLITSLYEYYLASDEYGFYEQIVIFIIWWAAYPIYAVGVVFYIVSVISGDRINTKTAWRLGARYWSPYIIMTLLVSLYIFIGFILLIIPGIIIAVRYAFAEFDLLLNESKPSDAMSNSWKLTKDYMWIILGGYTMITLVLYPPYFLIDYILDMNSVGYMIVDSLLAIVYSVFGSLYTIFAFRIFDLANSQYEEPVSPE